ncbi:MAG: DUF393 domain-containing protein [Deltaproteobacteria bacterium]|nr:DUF393 domain-containing protein [Deltaproteobacteria bacterium]MBK8239341.1 DUF393 domain-containing protein [Deltaproteobacteria bacterium]MBK8719584.1 DUF393 domain-containing protein [Deltaproteobacteria bacterium]MBP7291486.1 DUF393 domain-containing protein [Nannocystaceae bacterium]
MPETTWSVRVFHDGACPLCAREVALLRRLDRRHAIDFVDIAAPGFRAQDYGATWAQLMARIHAQTPDGRLIDGVEVFRRLYAAVGFGWLVALTRVPGISHVMSWAYDRFAERRLRLTGRCDGACPIAPGGSA